MILAVDTYRLFQCIAAVDAAEFERVGKPKGTLDIVKSAKTTWNAKVVLAGSTATPAHAEGDRLIEVIFFFR